MIEYGSDYLLGWRRLRRRSLRERDRLWRRATPLTTRCRMRCNIWGMWRFGNRCRLTNIRQRRFYIDGTNSSDRAHPKNTKRPAWEAGILADCAGDWDLQHPTFPSSTTARS